MGAIANVVLNDAAATPVAHTFNPSRQGLVNGSQIAEFEDRTVNAGVAVGFYRLSMDFSRPSAQRRSYRIKLKLETPQLENVTNSTVSGIAPAPTISYVPIAQADVVIPERATLQARKDLRKMFYEMFNNAQVVAAIENLDAPY